RWAGRVMVARLTSNAAEVREDVADSERARRLDERGRGLLEDHVARVASRLVTWDGHDIEYRHRLAGQSLHPFQHVGEHRLSIGRATLHGRDGGHAEERPGGVRREAVLPGHREGGVEGRLRSLELLGEPGLHAQ